MGTITKGKTWADEENVAYTDLNANFDTIYNEFNGSITNANLDASAAVDESKISFDTSGGHSHDGTDSKLIALDWIPAGETWTYASASDPEFTLTISGDKTSKYNAGMKVKLTQTTDKFFIITKVAYGAPNTTITLYGGTDYDLADATITSPTYSYGKAPTGFPMDVTKWSVELSDTTRREQTSPASGTVYNPGSLSITIPTGSWSVYMQFACEADFDGAAAGIMQAGLSTANNSFSDAELVGYYRSSSQQFHGWMCQVRKELSLSESDVYYPVIAQSTGSAISVIRFEANDNDNVIRAVSTYL